MGDQKQIAGLDCANSSARGAWDRACSGQYDTSENLADRLMATGEIHRVLKRGGLVGLRSTDCGATILEPRDPELERFWALFVKTRDALGGDSQKGRRLFGLLLGGLCWGLIVLPSIRI